MDARDKAKIAKLEKSLEAANESYRKGEPKISDDDYDKAVVRLRELDPENHYLAAVEPEKIGEDKIRHLSPMLSLEKAYTIEDLERFFNRIESTVEKQYQLYRVTPKLDGVAGRFYEKGELTGRLATRGNGLVGTDISSFLPIPFTNDGIIPSKGSYGKLGEIVVSNLYFANHLSKEFKHPRNFIAGMLGSDNLNPLTEKALKDGAVIYFSYTHLTNFTASREHVIEKIDWYYNNFCVDYTYPTDGIVIEAICTDEEKEEIGSTSHHNKWQIAFKKKGKSKSTEVLRITWQVGRTGKITPVLELEPIEVSGATIRRVTAHNASAIRDLAIGIGAGVEIIRSGEVIPYIERVTESGDEIDIPKICPSCGDPLSLLNWDDVDLFCRGLECPEQIAKKIEYWFSTMEIKNFGPATVKRILSDGIKPIDEIIAYDKDMFANIGFGQGEAARLEQSLWTGFGKETEDWRFLASFGLPHLGRGDSKKLLKNIPLSDLGAVSEKQIHSIKGFGDKTSKEICNALRREWELISEVMLYNFNLTETPIGEIKRTDSRISGKNIVFTGKMPGSRKKMKSSAEALGATVQNGVNSKTDILVVGESPGQNKLDGARKHDIPVMDVILYFEQILNR